jgi:hypothetical protein
MIMEWELFWSTLILEHKELAQESTARITMDVSGYKAMMKRAHTAGQQLGLLKAREQDKKAHAFTAIDPSQFSPEDIEQARQFLEKVAPPDVLSLLGGLQPPGTDDDEKRT